MNVARNKLEERMRAVTASRADAPTPPASGDTPPPAPRRAPTETRTAPPGAAQTWEDANRRATFHLPVALLEELDRHVARTGQSKASVVRAALEQYLNT